MAAVWIRDVRPHVGDVVRRHVGKNHPFWRGSALARLLQLAQFFLDPVAQADVWQLSREHWAREKHEHLLCRQLGPVGCARGVKHRRPLSGGNFRGRNVDHTVSPANPREWVTGSEGPSPKRVIFANTERLTVISSTPSPQMRTE